MKVKIITQLLSKSVTDALNFCKDSFKLKNVFKGTTIQFIELSNLQVGGRRDK